MHEPPTNRNPRQTCTEERRYSVQEPTPTPSPHNSNHTGLPVSHPGAAAAARSPVNRAPPSPHLLWCAVESLLHHVQLILQQGCLLILKRVVVAAVTPTLLIILVILVCVSRCRDQPQQTARHTQQE